MTVGPLTPVSKADDRVSHAVRSAIHRVPTADSNSQTGADGANTGLVNPLMKNDLIRASWEISP